MTQYWEILVPTRRHTIERYARQTLAEAIDFARDATAKGWEGVGVWHVTIVAGRTGKEHVPSVTWKESK